jgi:arylsulfatase A-like enzyme
MTTLDAIPSLLYGKRLVRSSIEGAGTRRLDFAGGASAVFGGGESVFAQVRSHGWNSAVAGWYLPYCRIFASQLTDCYWDARYLQTSSASPALLEAAVDETRMLFETAQASPFGRTLAAGRHAAEYAALLAAARRYAADPSVGMAFIHFNIPHKPYFFNPKTGRPGRSGYSAARYDDALELVDRSVSDILSSLNGAGLDSKTAIILSSDHPARFPTRIDGGQDPHVPFFVHLPGQADGVVSTQEFSTIRTADLVLAIAAGEVKSPADLEHFLTACVAPN